MRKNNAIDAGQIKHGKVVAVKKLGGGTETNHEVNQRYAIKENEVRKTCGEKERECCGRY